MTQKQIAWECTSSIQINATLNTGKGKMIRCHITDKARVVIENNYSISGSVTSKKSATDPKLSSVHLG